MNPLAAVSGLISGLIGLLGTSQLATTTSGRNQTVAVQKVVATPPTPTKVVGSAGLVINLIWDSSVAKAPASFKTALVQAAQTIGAHVTNKITLNIAVGYGEIDGQSLSSGDAEALTLGDKQESYALVKQQLTKSATGATDAAVLAQLPATNPYGKLTYDVAGSQLKVFGVISANSTALDGKVGFSTDWTGGELVAAALHELTHAMGRNSGWGSPSNGSVIGLMDLTRYSAPGVLADDGSPRLTRRTLQYFSLDGGKTVLAYYDNTSDYGDWANSSGTATDSFDAYIPSNPSITFTTLDLKALDSVGYTVK